MALKGSKIITHNAIKTFRDQKLLVIFEFSIKNINKQETGGL